MSSFLPDTTPKDALQPAAPTENIESDILLGRRILEALAQRPERIPSSFITQIIDQVQVANILVPISQIVGFTPYANNIAAQGESLQALYDQATTIVYDRAATTVDVVSSTTETAIYSKSIAGNDMSTDKSLRLTINGDYLHQSISNSLRIKVNFGGTTFWDYTTDFGTGTSPRIQPWEMKLLVSNLGATNSQMIQGHFLSNYMANATPTAGIGTVYLTNSSVPGMFGVFGISSLGTIDTTLAQTLSVTVQWSTSSASSSWRKRNAILELV